MTTEPSVIEYLLPWQSQLIVSVTVATMQPWCVHTALNALNSPSFGWVITVCASGKILPLPTGMSVSWTVSGPAALLEPPEAVADGSLAGVVE